MSLFYDTCDEIKELIESRFDSCEVAVVVDRQKDIASEFNKMIGKVSGGVVVIEWNGSNRTEDNVQVLRTNNTYFITVITHPVIRDEDKMLADELVEQIALLLHHWLPEGAVSKHHNRMEVTSILPASNSNYLIYQIGAKITLQHNLN